MFRTVRSTFPYTALPVALATLLIARPSAAQNLVTNGSFEDPAITSHTFALFHSIPGWDIASGPWIEIQNHSAGSPYDGNQFVELDSTAPTDIYQDISTEPGKTYIVSFAYSPRPYTGANDNHMSVTWDGAPVTTLQLDGTNLTDTQWKVYSYCVLAEHTTSRLQFNDLGTPNSYGNYLDAVSVVKDVPTISGASVDKPTLWSPNHKMVPVTVSYSVADTCDAHPVCWLDVSSNEADDGAGDGHTTGDIQIVDAHHVLLRAERSGEGTGRVYTITIHCQNASSEEATSAVTVTVPHNTDGD